MKETLNTQMADLNEHDHGHETSSPRTNICSKKLEGHAYHYNLPPQYIDPRDGTPLVTKYAQRKADNIVKIAYSIHLTEDMFRGEDSNSSTSSESGIFSDAKEGDDDDDELDSCLMDEGKATLVCLLVSFRSIA